MPLTRGEFIAQQPAVTSSLPYAEKVRRHLRPAVLGWFDHSKRDLPWRRTSDPYAIWVSEVMLQQTQVDRVIEYYERFLKTLPTVQALAAATVPEVLWLWRGLGYYSRARNLHKAAQVMVERFNGALPSQLEALKSLPGFGRYTAGAVASIAFAQSVPLVDGNVARVFSRLFEIAGLPGEKSREALLWQIAEALVEGARPGDFNQSLMELGATVCLPSRPLCLLCPVNTWCLALQTGRVAELPPPKKAAKRKKLEFAVAVAQRKGVVLMARRAESGLFGGLWEMPSVEIGADANGYAAIRGLLGKRATIGPEMSVIERTLTHRDLRLHLYPVVLPPKLREVPDGFAEWAWVPVTETHALGMSSAMEAALSFSVPTT